jgi:uncharacterized protein involved in exopolysaccharide biosynthesis
VRPDYAFRVVDPAAVPDLKDRVRPRRLAMIALGALFGGLFSLVIIGWQLHRDRLRQWRAATR